MIQHYINHIILVVDRSGSMQPHEKEVVKVFDAEISHLRKRSQELNQETRISIYLFAASVECLVFDMDVMRMSSLSGYYKTEGSTALMDATVKAIEDNQLLPQIYGDHAFLLYVLTDGEENSSFLVSSAQMRNALSRFRENWTAAIMVPNSRGKHEAKKFGFPEDSISIWDPNSVQGVEGVGKTFRSALEGYMTLRAMGARGTKSLFTLSIKDLSIHSVKQLPPLDPLAYSLLEHRKGDKKPIREFVEGWTGKPYLQGSSYYELVKPEIIQAQKEILVQRRATGEVFQGARKLIGLPDHEIKVEPGDFGEWRIFVQSTSVNRNVVPGQAILVRK